MEQYKRIHLTNRLDDKVLTVNFTCQRCCQPLRIHKTFNSADQNNLNTFTHLNLNDEDDEIKNESEGYKNFPYLMESGLNNDFLLVEGDSTNTETNNSSSNSNLSSSGRPQSITKPIKKTNQSTMNHPLCEDCADYIIDSMDNQLKVLEDECKVYKEFLEDLDRTTTYNATENEVNDLRSTIEKFKFEEKDLVGTLKTSIQEKGHMDGEIDNQHGDLSKVDDEANNLWCDYNYYKKKFFDCEDEIQSLDYQLKYAETHLDKVKNTNVFASAFHIWHDGHFGTINGLRLGRLPTFIVEWPEINAAWGQVALLLHSLAQKMNLVFKRYKLIPFGNHSFIHSFEQKKDFPLFGSGGYRFLWDSKFDMAMAAFLDCLQQFQEEIEKDSDFHLPYKIQNGKITDQTKHLYSIKICRNSEEEWTKALKFMLTDLKWIITYVTLTNIKP